MKQLEKRLYSRTELADITGRNPASGHFARDVRDDLTKWGYTFNWLRGQGASITRIPTTARERLAEIMIRQFGLDIQVDVYAFACFLYLILTMEEFACMPWAEREYEIWQQFEVSIAESTLRRWASRLLEGDNLHKDKSTRIYWRTTKFEGLSIREPIDAETDEDYIRYKTRRGELITEYTQMGLDKSKVWKETFKQLWGEFGCCYYACPRFTINAIGDEHIDEICDIVAEICDG